jgi:hypothetical protein
MILLGCSFLGISLGIPQDFREQAFEIWGICRNLVPFFTRTNIKRRTDGAETSKNTFLFHGEQVFASFH